MTILEARPLLRTGKKFHLSSWGDDVFIFVNEKDWSIPDKIFSATLRIAPNNTYYCATQEEWSSIDWQEII